MEMEPPPKQEENRVVTQQHWGGGGVQGEIDAGDIQLPAINLCQKVGDLGEQFGPGNFVFNKEMLLTNGTDPFSMTALRVKKQYQEAKPFNPDGPRPKVFDSAAEVREAGGHFNFDEKIGYYRDLGHLLVLVCCPKGLTPDQQEYFIFEFGGERYAMAKWTVTSGAYTAVAKPIISSVSPVGHLRSGKLHEGRWSVTAQKKANASMSWFAPVIKADGKNSEEFLKFAESLMD